MESMSSEKHIFPCFILLTTRCLHEKLLFFLTDRYLISVAMFTFIMKYADIVYIEGNWVQEILHSQ